MVASGSGLRYYATNWKVSGSIRDEVIGFLCLYNSSSSTMGLVRHSLQQKWAPGFFLRGKERPMRKDDKLTATATINSSSSDMDLHAWV
jgi:hypothetical protein